MKDLLHLSKLKKDLFILKEIKGLNVYNIIDINVHKGTGKQEL